MRLKKIREDSKKMQKEVAKDLGIGLSTFSQYETGKREPDNETLLRLANYFDVSVDYLLGNTDKPTPPEKKGQKKEAPIVSDGDLKFALFGGENGITDDMLKEVKDFADFVKSKKERDNDE